MHLDDMRLFVHIAKAGSLSAAARQLGLSPAAVSATIKRIESAHRLRLLERSTRSLRLTAEGERFLEGCQAVLERWEQTLGGMAEPGRVEGVVHVAAPSDTTYARLSPWFAEWQPQYPALRITLHVSDRRQDIKREAVDIAVRYGALPDSALIARALCDGPRVLVASPKYLKRAGMPGSPEQLAEHTGVFWQLDGRPNREWRLWPGRAGIGDPVTVSMPGALCGDGYLARQWALQGRGIAMKALCDVIDDLEAGRLLQVLPEYQGDAVPLHAVLPSHDHMPARVRAVLEFLVERYGELQGRMGEWATC